jgi:hypothetical protein
MTILNECLLKVIEKGYNISDDGVVTNPKGKILKGGLNHHGYRVISLRVNNKVYKIQIHRLQAYKKYGEKIFDKDILIRHLDGIHTNNNIENISIGTSQDNQLDRDKEDLYTFGKIGWIKKQDIKNNTEIRFKIYDDITNNVENIIEKYNLGNSFNIDYIVNKSVEYKKYKENEKTRRI